MRHGKVTTLCIVPVVQIVGLVNNFKSICVLPLGPKRIVLVTVCVYRKCNLSVNWNSYISRCRCKRVHWEHLIGGTML